MLRAIMDISARSISLAARPHWAKRVTSSRSRREDRPPSHLSLSQTSAGISIPMSWVPHQLSLVRPRLSLVPTLRFSRAAAHRSGQGWPSPGLAAITALSRPRLDRTEHGARLRSVGTRHRSSSALRTLVLWPAPPRRYGPACWPARSPTRCGAGASCQPRSRISGRAAPRSAA